MSLQVRDSLGTLYQVAGRAAVDSMLSATSKNPPMNKVVYQALQTKIDRTVTDLLYYYTKSQTYSKAEVDTIIGSINTLTIKVVEALPVTDISTTTLYFVGPQAGTNIYEQFVYVDEAWVALGSTEVDLSDYVTDTDLATALEELQLGDLFDINISEPEDGQILTYNAATGKWVNEDNQAVITALDDIQDVELTNLEDGQTIMWDATNQKWVNGIMKVYSAGYGVNITSEGVIDNKSFVGTQEEWDALTAEEQAVYDTVYITSPWADSNEVNVSYVDELPLSGVKDIIYGLVEYEKASETVADGFLDSVLKFTKTSGTGSTYTYTADGIQACTDDLHYKDFVSLEYDGTKFILTYYDDTTEDVALGDTFYWRAAVHTDYYAGRELDQTFSPLCKNNGGGSAIRVVSYDSSLIGTTVTITGGVFEAKAVFSPEDGAALVESVLEVGDLSVILNNGEETRTYTIHVPYYSFYEIYVTMGFDYEDWLTSAGIDPTPYEDLEEVFAEESVVRQLMLTHSSVDFLYSVLAMDPDGIWFNAFIGNDTAMKWIGLSDYAVNKFTSINGVEARLLKSTYWQRYAKDCNPGMTSASTPYGSCWGSNVYGGGSDSNWQYWYPFSNPLTGSGYTTAIGASAVIGYTFPYPFCCKAVYIYNSSVTSVNYGNITVQASNDNTSWETLGVFAFENAATRVLRLSNKRNYIYYKIMTSATLCPSTSSFAIFRTLTFYGRTYEACVPPMTSSALPYGNVTYNSQLTGYEAYKAFDGTSTNAQDRWACTFTGEDWIAYKFPHAVCVKLLKMINGNDTNVCAPSRFAIYGSLDNVTWTKIKEFTNSNNVAAATLWFDLSDNSYSYTYYRLDVLEKMGNMTYFSIGAINYYCLDFSEKEFASSTTRKWIFDHGVVLTPVEIDNNNGSTIEINSDVISMVKTSAGTADGVYVRDKINMTNYSVHRAKTGNIMTYSSNNRSGALVIMENAPAVYGGTSPISSIEFWKTRDPFCEGIDVTALTQNAQPEVAFTDAVKCTIKEWWLE